MTGIAQTEVFGSTAAGETVTAITLRAGGTRAVILTHGARLQSLYRDGIAHSLALGSREIAAYEGPLNYCGAVVGPVANRIAAGRFTLDGQSYATDRNEPGATLHGGRCGFSTRNWHLVAAGESACSLALTQPSGLCGFPGPIGLRVTYALEADGALAIAIQGVAPGDAVLCAPAFHGYWSLDGRADLSGHRLQVAAESVLPVDAAGLPCGAPTPVAGSAFDYRTARSPAPDLDHNFCLSPGRVALREVARLTAGSCAMTLETTEPGLQVYAGGTLDTAPFAGLAGRPYGRNAGIALEPQVWPDAANHADFPSARLAPGARYEQHTRFRFATL